MCLVHTFSKLKINPQEAYENTRYASWLLISNEACKAMQVLQVLYSINMLLGISKIYCNSLDGKNK